MYENTYRPTYDVQGSPEASVCAVEATAYQNLVWSRIHPNPC